VEQGEHRGEVEIDIPHHRVVAKLPRRRQAQVDKDQLAGWNLDLEEMADSDDREHMAVTAKNVLVNQAQSSQKIVLKLSRPQIQVSIDAILGL
jgi:hypothetical protein